MTTTLHIRLLGGFSLVYGETPVAALNSDRLQSFLVYLLLHRQAPQPRQHLAFLLWPDSMENQARGNLRNLLHQVRRGLPDAAQFIEMEGQTLLWKADAPFTLDVDEFQRGIREAARLEQAGAEDEARETLQAALAHYGGDLLPGNYDDWLLSTREELRQTFLDGLVRLVQLLEQKGEYREAIRYARRLLQHDPLLETGYVQLMRLHALNGDRTALRQAYQSCVMVLKRELDVEPGPATREAYAQYLAMELPAALPVAARATVGVRQEQGQQEMAAAAAPRPVALPSSPTRFLGREAELAEIADLLGDPACRVLTIVGPGGTGKSRLALRVAEEQARVFEDGAALVSLAPVSSAEMLVPAIGSAVGLSFSGPAEPKWQLFNFLHGREMLLVLDNMEHLLGATGLLMEMVGAAPRIKLLVTSRERLNAQAEWVFDLHGLPLPSEEGGEGFEGNSAVALFAQSARRVDSRFALSPETAAAVARICRLVDGMPLGIELAASWARMLSPEEIAGEIERSLDFLTTSTRNVPERHRSMRAVFDYSWNLLSEAEQEVLRGLSVFCGGFTRAAGEEVAGATLPFLTTLADKSLVRRTGAGRYDLHELVRQYGAARLAEVPGAQEAARARHCDYYAALLERRYGALRGPEQRATLDELQRDLDNARAAWDVAVTQGRVGVLRRAARGLALFYELNNWFHEGEAAFARAVPVLEQEMAGSGDARVALGLALMFQGVFHFRGGGQQEQGRALVERGVEVLREGEDQEALIDALNEQAFLSVRVGDYEGALRLLHEALTLGRATGYAWGTASSLSYLGVTRYSLAEFEEAHQWFSESYEVYRAIGDPSNLSYVLSYLGPIAAALGKADEAWRYCRESLALSEALGVRWSIAFALMNQGLAAYWLGDYEEAIAPLQRSVGLYREIGDRWSVGMALNRLGNGCAALGAWDEARRHYLGALEAAREVQVTSQALNALAGLARTFAAEGAIGPALELSILVRDHPQTARYTRPQMEGLLAELLPGVSQEEVAAAEERARGRTLEEVVDETLERYGDALTAQTSK